MVYKFVLAAAVVALASAGYDPKFMEMMQGVMNAMQHQGGNMNMGGNMNVGGNMPAPSGGCKDGNCQVPMGVDVGAYLEQQKEQQKFEQQKMAAQIKAQFDSVMKEVTMKKHKYAMGVMTEFTSMCQCLDSGYETYQSMFVKSARTLNMTDIVDMAQWSAVKPYEAKSLKEAKERLFAGMLESICKALGTYMEFSSQVEDQLTQLIAQGK